MKTAEQLVMEAVIVQCEAEQKACVDAGLSSLADGWARIEAALRRAQDRVYATLSATPEYALALQGYPQALAESAALVQLLQVVKQYLPTLLVLVGAGGIL